MTGTKLLKVTAEQPAQNLTMVIIIFRKSPYIKLGHLRRVQSFPNKLWWLWGEAETAQACLLGSCHAA